MKKIITIIILGALSLSSFRFAGENAPMAVKAEKENTASYWENYGDELLNGYIQEALENNLSIKNVILQSLGLYNLRFEDIVSNELTVFAQINRTITGAVANNNSGIQS